MASAKRERQRARKIAGGRVPNAACESPRGSAADTGEVVGVSTSRSARHSGDLWGLYARQAHKPEPDAGAGRKAMAEVYRTLLGEG